MSETVHYRGIATKIEQPNNRTLIDVAKDILKERNKEIADYYENALECLCDSYHHEFFYHPKTQILYKLDNNEHDPNGNIIRAEQREDGVIDYELRYYNGGAGFEECMEEAFDKLDISENSSDTVPDVDIDSSASKPQDKAKQIYDRIVIFEALYNPMTEESAYTTLSLHKTRDGAEDAIAEHKRKKKEDWKKVYPTKEDEPFEFGTFEDWTTGETDVLP